MPTDRDKANASLSGEGVARPLTIRHSRRDRDGLFLFGCRRESQAVILANTNFRALERGRLIAVDIENEHISIFRFASDGEGNRR